MVGSDIPGLSSAVLESSVNTLSAHEVRCWMTWICSDPQGVLPTCAPSHLNPNGAHLHGLGLDSVAGDPGNCCVQNHCGRSLMLWLCPRHAFVVVQNKRGISMRGISIPAQNFRSVEPSSVLLIQTEIEQGGQAIMLLDMHADGDWTCCGWRLLFAGSARTSCSSGIV